MFLSDRFSNYDITGDLNPLAYTYKKLLEGGKKVIDLTVSNPTKVGFSYPEELIKSAFNTREIFEYNPEPQGLYTARKSISEYYSEQGYEVDPKDIFLVSGTSEGYSYLLKLLCNPGESILVPAPSYPLLDFIATLENVEIERFELRLTSDNQWKIDLDNIYPKIKSNTKAILFVQPNNPTGTILDESEGEKLIELCEKRGISLIIDEVFREFLFDENETVHLFSSSQIPIFVLNGISKTLALPQFKLGWIIAFLPKKLKRELHEALEIIADTYLSVNTPIQVALERLLRIKNEIKSMIMNRLTTNLGWATKNLSNNSNLTVYKPQGGWYMIIKFANKLGSEELAVNFLKSKGVYLHPGSMFSFHEDKFLVVSLLTPSSDFIDGLEKLQRFINSLESS